MSQEPLRSAMKLSTLALFFLWCATWANGANILFFYGGGTYSHKLTIWPLASALADQGHNVTFLSPYHKRPWSHANITELVPPVLEKLFANFHVVNKLDSRLAGEENYVWDTLTAWSLDISNAILSDYSDPGLNNLLRNDDTTFDLIVVNAVFGESAYILRERWNSKLILMDSTSLLSYFNDMLGHAPETSWVPDITSQFLYPMSFFNRVRNYFYSLNSYFERKRVLYPALEQLMSDYLKRDSVQSFSELERKNTHLVMLNTHYTTDFARALPPNYILVGGLHIWERRKDAVPNQLQEFMDGADDDAGIVLIIFGTSCDLSTTGKHFLGIFFDTVRAFPKTRFVISWAKDIPEDAPKNALLANWLPQKEILAHHKIKLFITHCGLYSISEATYHGVPMVGLPLWADEDYDAYRIAMEEIGVILEVKTLTTQELINAVKTVTTDPKYRKNIRTLSKITRDRPMDPLKTAVWWSNFLLRQEYVSAMRPKTDHLTWAELRSLDVHAFLILSTLFGLYVVGKTMKYLAAVAIGTRRKKPTKK